MTAPTIHATAVLFGTQGIVIRGSSGSGKSRLSLALLERGPFARLIGDDRISATAVHGRLLLRPAPSLEGLLEIRGLGIRRVAFEPVAVAHLVVDLGAADAKRLPEPEASRASIEGIAIARLPVAPDGDALALIDAFLRYGGAPTEPPGSLNPR